MKIYIAGKITNNPNFKEQFKEKELELKLQGHTVINPTILSDIPLTHGEYLHICKAMIDVCEAVYFLDNWQDSKGATEEYHYAKSWGKKIIMEGMI